MFKKLLVPVDLSDLALTKAALEKAKGLAATWGGELRLVYVMPIVPSTYLEYVPADFESGEKVRVEKELKELGDGLGLPAGKVTSAIRSGGVYHEVLAEAEESKADLIVCGSHWPTLATYLIGSHATNIVRHAMCSVLVVRG
ncbi:MAG: universal stress protein UspA [Rhizobiales bacterium PAR1]|nr:MAG: universal stress protein UspA [Rhizobiales bacterium PAR1]